jgi:protease-4
MAHDYFADRKRERRWRSLWRLFWGATLLFLIWVWWPSGSWHQKGGASPHTALIEVRGEIAEDTEAGADALLPALRDAFEDEGAQAVVLRFNSPGGSPVQSGLVNDEIRRLKALHQKPVYAVVEEMCASGAYYMAVAADEIYVDKASVVGSIGVLMDGFGFTGLLNKAGVERRLYTAGENKGINDPFSAVTPAQRAHTQAMLDQIHQQFIEVVTEGRGERLKPTQDMFSGLYWNGEQAVQLGLADHLGSLDYVAREVVKAPDIVNYSPQENVTERLARHFGASVGRMMGREVSARVWRGLQESALSTEVRAPRLR